MAASNLKEPEEKTNITEDLGYAQIEDPLTEAPTVDREYSQGFKTNPGAAPIPEPTIQQPSFEEPTTTITDENGDAFDFDKKEKSSSNNNDDDDDDGFGFELNGDTAIYLLDFVYNLFKEQYKVSEKLLEKHGLDKETFNARIVVEGQRMTVSQFAEQVNAAMDEIGISTKDKNQIKKIIIHLSKKHDVKMTPEAQLLVVIGKIGFETHIQLKMLQAAVLERLVTMTPDYQAANAQEAPSVDEVMSKMAGEQMEEVKVEEVRRNKKTSKHKKTAKTESKTNNIDLAHYIEPGEKT
jgi:hypothetical protein